MKKPLKDILPEKFDVIDWLRNTYGLDDEDCSSAGQVQEICELLSEKVLDDCHEKLGEVDKIFSWLLGENGDFPDLSQKPHYSFRTELRKRLDQLQAEDVARHHGSSLHIEDN